MIASGVEWLGDIPSHWNIIKGRYAFNLLNRPVLPDDEIITCFRDGEVTLRKNRREDGFTMADYEYGYQGIESGDLIIHGMDGFAGAIGISDSRGKGSPVLNVLDTQNCKKYMVYYLRSLAYSNVFVSLFTGIRVRSCDLRWKKIAVLPILVPPLSEQTKIANYLDSKTSEIKSLIDNLNKQIESLKEYKKSLIYKCVTKGLDDSVPLKDSGIEWIGQIPENWNIVKLKTNYDFINGFAFDSNHLSLDGKYPVIRIRDFTETYIDFKNANKIDDNSLLDKYLVKSNDILIAMSGTVGKLVQITNLDKECYINQRVGIIRAANTKILPRYVYYSLSTVKFLEYINLLSAGSAQLNISGDEILNYPICFEDHKSQIFISNYLDKECLNIDHLISLKQKTIEKLTEYQKSLIYEYVTGKKEIV